MPNPRNIALTVHELEAGEFYWVLMEAVDDGSASDAPSIPGTPGTPGTAGTPGTPGTPGAPAHVYLPLEAALEPYTSYSNALVAGVAVMRRLFGPEGKPGSL